MPRYYCDYCDAHLTHDSNSVRKQHNAGFKHKANVRNYYLQFEEQLAQRAAASAPAVGGAAAAYHAQVNQVLQRNLGGVPAIGTMAYHLPPAGYPGALPPGVPAGMAYRQPPPGPPGGYAAPKPF